MPSLGAGGEEAVRPKMESSPKLRRRRGQRQGFEPTRRPAAPPTQKPKECDITKMDLDSIPIAVEDKHLLQGEAVNGLVNRFAGNVAYLKNMENFLPMVEECDDDELCSAAKESALMFLDILQMRTINSKAIRDAVDAERKAEVLRKKISAKRRQVKEPKPRTVKAPHFFLGITKLGDKVMFWVEKYKTWVEKAKVRISFFFYYWYICPCRKSCHNVAALSARAAPPFLFNRRSRWTTWCRTTRRSRRG